LEAFGLPAGNLDRPLIGIISRFANQKGFDLIADVAHEIAAEDVALVALGTGDPEYEQLFRDLAAAYPDRFGARIAYDDTLAHKIEAGSDLFLMPSWFEPCGLNQMYSLRYGTVPIVRATGGLDDSIGEETGFKFREYSGKALLDTVRRALQSYADPIEWQRRMRRGMAQDYSWGASAARYSQLYQSLVS
ncbi:MAG: glycosyltransferase, partial [Bryobacteraceae bacterium]|nr:glycosyltransferase [Bryobacteraceae bacterium]